MKTSATFRIITVAIGILVAMLILLTLWVRMPRPSSPGSSFMPQTTQPFTTKTLLEVISGGKKAFLSRQGVS